MTDEPAVGIPRTKAEVIAEVGEARYRAASVAYRADSLHPDYPQQGSRSAIPKDLQQVPHEIGSSVGYGPLSAIAKLELLVACDDDIPTYGLLMDVSGELRSLGAGGRADLWRRLRDRLAHPDQALAPPIAFTLWADYFGSEWAGEAWEAFTAPGVADAVLRAALTASVSIAYARKAPVFARLAPDPSWHGAMYGALLGAAFDVNGRVDPVAATALLARLTLPADTPGIEHLADLEAQLDLMVRFGSDNVYDLSQKRRASASPAP